MSGHELKNTEEVFNELLKHPDDVVISPLEAAAIWKLFKGFPIDSGTLDRLEYRAFLQAALMAAIDGSSALAWVQSLWESAIKPDATAASVIKAVLKGALQRYYRHSIKGEAPPIYNMTLGAIAYQCDFYFKAISAGMDL
jgi:hypothetical protein